MCGFAGILGEDLLCDPARIKAMTSSMRHRGPDDEAYHAFSLTSMQGGAFMPEQPTPAWLTGIHGCVGFRRLAIQDLSMAGRQPMMSDDGSTIIVFNGEVYNAPSLRQELLSQHPVRFRGTSDTEVILRLYGAVGFERMIDRLDGMFAICIVDLREGRVFLCRDHAGIKPLYVYRREGTVLFASEVKAFHAHPQFECEPDAARLSEYLMFRHVAGDATLYRNVEELPAGCYDTYWANSGRLHSRRCTYYRLPEWAGMARTGAGFLERLESSVRMQLISDVPVGCQLSGGIDSSLVSVLANRSGAKFDTYSVIVDDPRHSEERYVDVVNSAIGCPGNKFTITDAYFVQNLEEATRHLDHPIHHPNSIGIHFLARNSRPSVTVMLSGEGADEMFGGYSRFVYARVGGALGNRGLRLLNRMSGERTILNRFGALRDRCDNYIALTGAQPGTLHSHFPDFSLDAAIASRRSIFAGLSAPDFEGKIFEYEYRVYLASLLKRQDKMTMAFSMENRVPFLGRTFIAECRRHFCSRAFLDVPWWPLSRRQIMRSTKIGMKRTSEAMFGPAFTYRAKQGFAFPIGRILARDDMNERFIDRYMPLLVSRAGMDRVRLESLWDHRANHPDVAFTVVGLGAWLAVNAAKSG